jgi:phage baseplate assembly protein W
MAYQIININDVTSNNELIGLGVSFSETSPMFRTIYSSNDQAVQNLKSLLLTRKGERYMEPNFGTNLLNIVFQPNISNLKQEISDILLQPIAYWLPYINVDNLDIITADDDPNLQANVKITLEFSVDNFNTNSITLTADSNGRITIT